MFTALLARLGLDGINLLRQHALIALCLALLLAVFVLAKCSRPTPPPPALNLSAVEALVDAKVTQSEARLEAKFQALEAKIKTADQKVIEARRALKK
jgi:hypothetical protein